MYLYGASGHAKVIIDILKDNNKKIDGLFDDDNTITELSGHPVLNPSEICGPLIISIGNNGIRKKIAKSVPVEFGTAIHSSAIISSTAKIAGGTVVMQGAIIQAEAQIGKHCIINTAAAIDHDCRIEDYVHISPQATLCGNVTVEEGTWVGAGAVISPGITIGKWSVIGAGSVVIEDIPDHVIAVGNPCRVIKEINYER